MPHELARLGWVVRVDLRINEKFLEGRLFAVGAPDQMTAVSHLDRFPGIEQSDPRTTLRQLSNDEIAALRLREGGVRPLILSTKGDHRSSAERDGM